MLEKVDFGFGIPFATGLVEVVSNTDLFRKGEAHKIMAEDNSTGSNAIWAVAMIIIVAMIAGAVYYSGMLSGTKKHDVDVEVKVPSASQSQ